MSTGCLITASGDFSATSSISMPPAVSHQGKSEMTELREKHADATAEGPCVDAMMTGPLDERSIMTAK